MNLNGKIVPLPESLQEEDEIPGEILPSLSDTPLHKDAFLLSETEKIRIISRHFREIMHTLGLDLNDDSLKDTPMRVARMYVREIFSGLDPKNKPSLTLFANTYQYRQMLVEKNISFHSNCEHHFVPIYGKAHVAYIPAGQVIGLSKIHRVVQYYAKRPQVQERLTLQILKELQSALGTADVAVLIDATHFCVSSRGIRDEESSTVTSEYGGVFRKAEKQQEFLRHIL